MDPTTVITLAVKVAVSITVRLFAEAESLAKRYKVSRSNFYSRALRAFIGRHRSERLTEVMNAVVDAINDTPDPFTSEAARRTLISTEW